MGEPLQVVYVIPSDNTNMYTTFSDSQRLPDSMKPFGKVVGSVLFLLVLGCGIISTLSLLILTSNSSPCSQMSKTSSKSNALTYLIICLASLEVVNMVKHLCLSCQVYNQCWPKGAVLVWVLASSSISTVGICLLLFHILPRVDLIRGCLLINSFGFLPLLCKTFLSPTLSDKHIKVKSLLTTSFLQMMSLGICTLHDFTTTSFTPRDDGSFQRHSIVWTSPNLDSLLIIATIFLVPFYWLDSYIERDVEVLGKHLPLVSFKKELNRSKHKAGLILPFWRGLWFALCLLVLVPDYVKVDSVCTKLHAGSWNETADDLKVKLVNLLHTDEKHGSTFEELPEGITLDWRNTYMKKEFDPSWIPPQNVAPVPMVPTLEIKFMLEQLLHSKYFNDIPQYNRTKERLDSIILRGRYTRLTISVYQEFVSHVEDTHITTLPEEHESAFTACVVAIFCSNVVTLLAAKAACYWNVAKFGYVVPACLIMPLSILLITLECALPAPSVAPLLKCPEPWSAESITLLVLLAAWYSSQLVLFSHCHTGNQRLESPLEFSVPLISASLTYGPAYKTINPGTKIYPLQHSKSYRFNYINRKSCKNSESEEETNQDT